MTADKVDPWYESGVHFWFGKTGHEQPPSSGDDLHSVWRLYPPRWWQHLDRQSRPLARLLGRLAASRPLRRLANDAAWVTACGPNRHAQFLFADRGEREDD